MEKPNSTTKIWLLFGASTLGMVVFAVLYFSNPNTATNTVQAHPTFVTNTVVNVVTNEIVKEMPKEVEKIVKVPAEIPEQYILVMNLYQRMTNATDVEPEQALFKMKDVRVVYVLSDAVKQLLSQDEIKAKFELTLRRNNVPLNPDSLNVIILSVGGFFDSVSPVLCYSINCSVDEQQWVFRGGDCHRAAVRVWTKGNSFGTVGKAKANDSVLNDAEKVAEIFANDFLSANPKP